MQKEFLGKVTISDVFLVATPPNALVFQGAGGDITIPEMLKVMIFPNIMCLIVLVFFHITYGTLIFQFGDYEYKSFNLTDVAGAHGVFNQAG